jgi:hypothetical protein
MAVRGDDQIGAIGNFRGRDQLGVGLHGDLDTGGTGGRSEPVVGIRHNHPDDVDSVLPQHIQGRHTEMTGADEGDPHGGCSVTGET